MDAEGIKQYLLDNDSNYIEIQMNAPSTCQMGDAFDRQISSIRNVLATLLH